jgi:hypothetical protein
MMLVDALNRRLLSGSGHKRPREPHLNSVTD